MIAEKDCQSPELLFRISRFQKRPSLAALSEKHWLSVPLPTARVHLNVFASIFLRRVAAVRRQRAGGATARLHCALSTVEGWFADRRSHDDLATRGRQHQIGRAHV